MAEFLAVDQLAFTAQGVAHRLIRLVDVNAGEFARRLGIGAISLDQINGADVVGLADFKVFHTMVRGGVYGTGTRVGGNMVSEDHRHLPVIDRMFQRQALQRRTGADRQHFIVCNGPATHDAFDHVGRDNHPFRSVTGVHLHQGVLKIGVQRHRLVGGNGPGGSGPDNHRDRALALVRSEQG